MNSPSLKPGDIVRLWHSEPRIVVVLSIVDVPLVNEVRFTWVHYYMDNQGKFSCSYGVDTFGKVWVEKLDCS